MSEQFDYTPPIDWNENDGFNQTQTQQFNGHARGYSTASLILGILSIVCCCCCCCFFFISIALSIVSIIMAVLAKRDNGGVMPPKAKAGLILAIIGIVLFLIWAVIYGIFTVAPEMFSEYLDPVFQEEYGMSFEEYMDSMYGEGTFETGDPLE